jgi:hypothetical protein
MSITGNSAINAADPSDINYYKHFYYFFYNTSLRLSNCPSSRVPIVATTATAPVITLAGNVLSSNVASGNQWYLNGSPIGGATNQNYTATSSGLYKTVITDSYGCTLESNQINFIVTAVTDPGAEIGLIVAPNPAHAYSGFTLQFTTRTKADLDISLTNTLGQEVYHSGIPDFVGHYSKQISPTNLSSGIYYLRIQHDKKTYIRKIVITP